MNSVYEVCMIFQTFNFADFPNNNDMYSKCILAWYYFYFTAIGPCLYGKPTTVNCVWAVGGGTGMCSYYHSSVLYFPTLMRGMGNPE
jgi:hypothetical protein